MPNVQDVQRSTFNVKSGKSLSGYLLWKRRRFPQFGWAHGDTSRDSGRQNADVTRGNQFMILVQIEDQLSANLLEKLRTKTSTIARKLHYQLFPWTSRAEMRITTAKFSKTKSKAPDLRSMIVKFATNCSHNFYIRVWIRVVSVCFRTSPKSSNKFRIFSQVSTIWELTLAQQVVSTQRKWSCDLYPK